MYVMPVERALDDLVCFYRPRVRAFCVTKYTPNKWCIVDK